MTRKPGTPISQQSFDSEEREFWARPARVEGAQLKRIARGMRRFLPQNQRLRKAGITRVRATESGAEVAGVLFTSCTVEGKKFVVDFTARTGPDGRVVSATINGKPACSGAPCD